VSRARIASRVALAASLALTGCASGVDPRVAFVAPALTRASGLPTVVVVRGAEGVDSEEAAVVEAAAALELEATGRFAPLALSRGMSAALSRESASWTSGPPPLTLVGLSRRFGADAIAVLVVRSFDPYPPAQISIALEVHATETMALLFSGSLAIDCGDGDAASELRSYRRETGDAVHEPRGRPVVVLSRERLARFACRELMGVLGP
jgi:hypothetical protein